MSESLSIVDALKQAQENLVRSDSAALEAEILLSHVLGKPRTHLRTWPEQSLGEDQQQRFFNLIARRAAGEPVAYLTGRREFWSLELEVNPHTLIPRPETELLVETALARISFQGEAHIADLGTGSGAIALAIASERPRCRVVATDICSEVLATAQNNARRLKLSNVEFRQGEWLAPLRHECFDVIVSNPPYVAEHDPHLAEGDLPAEPRRALVAGPLGLEMIAAIVEGASGHLREGGWLLMEHGYDQAAATAGLLREAGYDNIQTWRDAVGIERVSGGKRG